MQVELLAKDAELQSTLAAAQQTLAEADSRSAAAGKEAEKWGREAEDRRMQLSVLMETLETLQAGSMGQLLLLTLLCFQHACMHHQSMTAILFILVFTIAVVTFPLSCYMHYMHAIFGSSCLCSRANLMHQSWCTGEKEQRIVSLTARFAAARLKEAAAVRRADDLTKEAASREEAAAQLHARLEAAERQLAPLHADLDAADKHAAQLTAQLDAAISSKAAAEEQLAAGQAQLLVQEEVARAAAAEAEQQALQAQQALSAAQAELNEARENADR